MGRLGLNVSGISNMKIILFTVSWLAQIKSLQGGSHSGNLAPPACRCSVQLIIHVNDSSTQGKSNSMIFEESYNLPIKLNSNFDWFGNREREFCTERMRACCCFLPENSPSKLRLGLCESVWTINSIKFKAKNNYKGKY